MKQLSTMPSITQYLSKMALLAIAYYVSGRLGLLLAVPPGYATAMWPPSGFALAGILLLGYRYWPGVLLGSFAVNLFTSFDPSNASSMLTSGSIAVIIAGGATLQAVVSAWLCRRWIAFPNTLEQTRDIGLLLTLGGPAGCLVNSLIGIGTLTAFGLIPMEKSPFNWLTWWVGDTIGVLVFTPIVLLIGNKVAQVSNRRKKVASLALIATFAVTIAIFIAARDWEHERQQFSFERKAALVTSQLDEHIKNHTDDIYALSLFYSSSENVTRTEFKTFVTGILERHAGGMRGLTWAPQIADSERQKFEETQRRDGFSDFKITEQDEDRRIIPAARREFYYPVTYIEPYAAKLHGFDNNSEEIRRATLEKARDQGNRQATSRLNIIQKEKDNYGMLVFRPVYRNGAPKRTVTERRQNLKGFIVGAFILPDLIEASLKSIEDNDLDLYITDDDSPPEKQLLYDSRTVDHKESRTALASHPEDLHWQRQIDVAGRSWTIHCVRGRAALLAHQNWTVWLVLAGGLLFTGLFGVFVMMVTARTDIVRRLVEQRTRELRESEETFRLAMEHASIGMALVGLDGRWLKVNKALCELIGYREPELMRIDFQTITHPEDLQADLERVRQTLAGTIQAYQIEKRYLHKDGRTIWVLLSVSLVRNVDGSPKYFISQIQDITQRREMERMKSEFISTVSHELRTPLTSIAGSLGLLAGGAAGELPQKALHLIGIAEQNSWRLVRLINDILDIEKAEAGRLEFHLEVQPLEPIVRQAIEENQAYAARFGVGIELISTAADIEVQVDRTRLIQVLTNLISNAAKFSPQGATVSLDIRAQKDSVRVSVQDRGPGIAENFRNRLFEKFAQADSSDSRSKGGTGLGLSIVKTFMERLGGSIDYETVLDGGTTFFITLPLHRRPTPHVVHRLLREGRPRVLYVEDDVSLTQMIEIPLGVETDVTVSHTLADARGRIQSEQYDLVILDMALEDGSGLELLPLLGSKERPSPPVIIYTVREPTRDISKRVQAVLVKSRHSVAELLAMVHRLCGLEGKTPRQAQISSYETSNR